MHIALFLTGVSVLVIALIVMIEFLIKWIQRDI